MIAIELISDTVPSLKLTDTVQRALDWMQEFKLSQLPIVEEGEYEGLVTEDEMLDSADASAQIKAIRYNHSEKPFIHNNRHIYEVIQVMSNRRLELLPVIDAENMYMGSITLKDLANYFSELFATSEPGGIIVLEIPRHSYSLSEIGRIVESTDSKVLSLYLSSVPGSSCLYVTMKLNVQNISRVISAFERFSYQVVMTYFEADFESDLKRNMDAFWRYLNV